MLYVINVICYKLLNLQENKKKHELDVAWIIFLRRILNPYDLFITFSYE